MMEAEAFPRVDAAGASGPLALTTIRLQLTVSRCNLDLNGVYHGDQPGRVDWDSYSLFVRR